MRKVRDTREQAETLQHVQGSNFIPQKACPEINSVKTTIFRFGTFYFILLLFFLYITYNNNILYSICFQILEERQTILGSESDRQWRVIWTGSNIQPVAAR